MIGCNIVTARFVFDPVYVSLENIGKWKDTPSIDVKPESHKITRFFSPIANVGKKALAYTAMALAILAVGIFSIFSLPVRYLTRCKMNTIDYDRLNPAERSAVKKEIEDYVEQHGGKHLSSGQKADFTYAILLSYSRSKTVYGPVARAWTEHLLDKANKENRKLVFLARDGIAPYKMARKLMATPEYQSKYPNVVGINQVALGYISRKVMESLSKSEERCAIFQEYAEKEIGIKKGQSCIFVDVGFAGSMIAPIRGKLPNSKIDFEYLISLTDKANGYITAINRKIYPDTWAGQNPGSHWLEDTHQGNFKSPSELVKVEERIYPNTIIPKKKQYCTEPNSLESMIRKFSQKAIVRCYQDKPLSEKALEAAKATFVETLDRIKRYELPLFVVHK